MTNLEKLDYFKFCPIKEFIGAGYEKYRPHWKWERNINNASLYLIAEGSLDFCVGNNMFTASRNDVVFLTKSDIATIRNNCESHSSLFYIAFNFDENISLLSESVFKSTSYRHLFKDILDAHLSKAPFSSMRINQLFTKLLYNLSVDSLQKRKDYVLTSRIQSAAEYININYYKNISIENLCNISGYSPAHLRRLFIKTFGVSPNEYIINKRIEMAKEMLLDIPEKNIEEISDLLGVSSSSYFCKLFKTKTGYSPGEYKNLKQNVEEQKIMK